MAGRKDDQGLIRLNVVAHEDLHQRLKMAVAENRTTVRKYVEDAIREKIENDERKKREIELTDDE